MSATMNWERILNGRTTVMPTPDKEDILAERNRVIAKHRNTIFIGAHVGKMPEELATVSKWLDM